MEIELRQSHTCLTDCLLCEMIHVDNLLQESGHSTFPGAEGRFTLAYASIEEELSIT